MYGFMRFCMYVYIHTYNFVGVLCMVCVLYLCFIRCLVCYRTKLKEKYYIVDPVYNDFLELKFFIRASLNFLSGYEID